MLKSNELLISSLTDSVNFNTLNSSIRTVQLIDSSNYVRYS